MLYCIMTSLPRGFFWAEQNRDYPIFSIWTVWVKSIHMPSFCILVTALEPIGPGLKAKQSLCIYIYIKAYA